MSFKREILPDQFKTGDELTADLVGVGIRLTGNGSKDPNIENTLIAASIEGFNKDGRVISLLIDWLEIHHQRINVDRLFQVINALDKSEYKNIKIFWTAVSQWLKSDIRFKKFQKIYQGSSFNYLGERTDFLIQKNGEDPRFKNTLLKVPHKVFRHRPEDILSPCELAKIHLPYRYRVMIGPGYRADMWAYLKRNKKAKASEMARYCYGSYPTAFAVKKDYEITRQRKVA